MSGTLHTTPHPESACLVVTLENPGKRNALDAALWQALGDLFLELTAENLPWRSVILTGAGNAFAAGGDLEEFPRVRADLASALDYHEGKVGRALRAIAECPLPVIAAIEGPCIGGGLEIAALCDLRVAGRSTRFGAPIARLGFWMYPGELALLRERLPEGLLAQMLLEGAVLDAERLWRLGVLHHLVEDGHALEEALAVARRIATGAPRVARMHKYWLRRLRRCTPLSEEEKRAGLAFLDDPDYREGLSAFLEKRPPCFGRHGQSENEGNPDEH